MRLGDGTSIDGRYHQTVATSNCNPTLFVTTRDELSLAGGSEAVDAYLRTCGFGDYTFLYARVMRDGGREAVHATFHRLAPGVRRSTLTVSAVREHGQWKCRHFEELAPVLSAG